MASPTSGIRMRAQAGLLGRISLPSFTYAPYCTIIVFDLPEPLPSGTYITFVFHGYRCGALVQQNQSSSRSVAYKLLLREDKKTPWKGVPTDEPDGFKFLDLPSRNGSSSNTATAAAAAAAASCAVATTTSFSVTTAMQEVGPPATPAAAPAAAAAAAAPAAAAPAVVIKPEKLTDEEIAEVKRRIHKDQTEEQRLGNKKVDPAYPSRISKPAGFCEDDIEAMRMRIATLEAQVDEYKKAGKRRVDPPRSPDREYAAEEEVEVEAEEVEDDSELRKDYDDLNTKSAKVRKICHEIGVDKIIDAVLADPSKQSELIKPTKDCVSLINRNGGAEECAREIKAFKEFHRQRYSMSLITLGLQVNDIVRIKVPETDFYTIASVLGTPSPLYPTCPRVSTLFVNDGDAHNGSTLSMAVGGDTASIQRFVNNKDIIELINSVFELGNLDKLHAAATSLKYTKLTKFNYAKELYKRVVQSLAKRFPEKEGFLRSEAAKIRQVLSDQGPVAEMTLPQRYARAFSSSTTPAAASASASSSSVVQIDDDE